MFTRIPVFATVLSALATAVVAAPEVIPGPKLPYLASLNLTSAELYARGRPPALRARAADYNPVCQTSSTAAVNDVKACLSYLDKISITMCEVGGQSSGSFCEAGTAKITGSNISGKPSTESICGDVAEAVQWVISNCDVGGQVGGSDAAFANGGLIVSVTNINSGK